MGGSTVCGFSHKKFLKMLWVGDDDHVILSVVT